MEIKVYAVVHVDAGIVHDVRPFTEEKEAWEYRDELAESFRPEGWGDEPFTYLDYNEGEGQLHIQETLLDFSRPELDELIQRNSIAMRFVRAYFMRYDMQLPCLEGMCFARISDEDCAQILQLVCDIMMSESGIQGILDSVS